MLDISLEEDDWRYICDKLEQNSKASIDLIFPRKVRKPECQIHFRFPKKSHKSTEGLYNCISRSQQLYSLSERSVQPTKIIARDGNIHLRTAINGQLADWLKINQVDQLEDRSGQFGSVRGQDDLNHGWNYHSL